MNRIALLTLAMAGGVAAYAATQGPTAPPRPAATVQQVMQAILFPNANVIFAAEGSDPETIPRDAKPSASTNPLTGLYGGWLAVENSGLALLESADLLGVAARACANGTLAPVGESQWKVAVESMRDAARASVTAARARSQEQIGAAAEMLSESCSACHRLYRRAGNRCSR